MKSNVSKMSGANNVVKSSRHKYIFWINYDFSCANMITSFNNELIQNIKEEEVYNIYEFFDEVASVNLNEDEKQYLKISKMKVTQ